MDIWEMLAEITENRQQLPHTSYDFARTQGIIFDEN